VPEIFVTVGRLGRARGVKGEVYIIPMTDFPERFLSMSQIHLKNRDQWETVRLQSARLVSGRPVIKLEGIETPEEASRLTNREVGVPKDAVIELPEGSFWIYDLIGCEVLEEDTGSHVGEIVNVETYPANDVYTIKTSEGKEVLIAAVAQFVKSVDITSRKITIDRAGIVEP
jgi:16S rRNA processing protein RimM